MSSVQSGASCHSQEASPGPLTPQPRVLLAFGAVCWGHLQTPCTWTASIFFDLLISLWILVCFQRLAMELAPNQATFLMSPLSIGGCHIGNDNP